MLCPVTEVDIGGGGLLLAGYAPENHDPPAGDIHALVIIPYQPLLFHLESITCENKFSCGGSAGTEGEGIKINPRIQGFTIICHPVTGSHFKIGHDIKWL